MSDMQQHALNYYHQQQLPPGWADLFGVIVNGMMDNAGEQEGLAFLRHMGEQLAERYPLSEAITVVDLEQEMNQVLSLFHWGCVDLRPYENRLEIYHLALPGLFNTAGSTRWRMAMAAVLQGLYSRWLREQGGAEQVPLSYQETDDSSVLLFRYQH
ncbi:cellulose biosynthesis protein BcsD [Dickeya chrysanthemi]|uniref:Cellulose biosynthesis protein BcsD n=1 Tax=Dickeya chrysanthemi TaxID=556 RepID=A0ABU8JLB6_DICCH